MEKPNKTYKTMRKRLRAPEAGLLMNFLSDAPTILGCLGATAFVLWLLTR
jgi:hypothetical protein